MSVSSTEHLDKLAFILYDRPSGRNIIGYAIEHIEQLRADLATQQNCCDGAAAQDAHVRREREEYRAEVEKLRAEIERQRAEVHRHTRHIELLYDQVRRRADERDKAQIEVEQLRADLALEQSRIVLQRGEIEKLRAENERLRKALQDIADDCGDDYPPSHGAIKYAVQDALRGKP